MGVEKDVETTRQEIEELENMLYGRHGTKEVKKLEVVPEVAKVAEVSEVAEVAKGGGENLYKNHPEIKLKHAHPDIKKEINR